MKHNTFILKCFLQFTCANLDGSQKEGCNFLNLLEKEGVLIKGWGWGGVQPWRKLYFVRNCGLYLERIFLKNINSRNRKLLSNSDNQITKSKT